MNFLKDPRTNWKYILIAVVLVVLVSGGILWQSKRQEVPPAELTKIEKPEKLEDETANWKIYRNEEYGFEFRYPTEWGDITSRRVEENITIGWYGITHFSFEKEGDVYLSIINIEDWPDGIYEEYYEGPLLLKINMNKQKQYIEEASEGDKCYEAVSSQYNKAFKFQGLKDCRVIFLTENIKAQLDYPYFVPMFSLAKTYTFYKENYRFTFGLTFSEFAQILSERSGPERRYAYPLYEQEFIEKFKNLLNQKVAENPYTNQATINLSESFDQMLSTFRFLE